MITTATQVPRVRRDFRGAESELLESASRGILESIRELDRTGYADTTRLKDGLADIEAEMIARIIEKQRATEARYIAHYPHRYIHAL